MTPLRYLRGEVIKRQTESGVIEKRCPICRAFKPHDRLHYPYQVNRGHFHAWCRDCFNAAARTRYSETRRACHGHC